MSASGTSFPDPDWPRQGSTRPDLPSPHHFPPDPLLSSGSFIDSSTARCGTLPSSPDYARDLDGNHRKKPDTSATLRSPLPADPLNPKKLAPDSPTPGNGDSSAPKKVSASRGTDASPKSALSDRPNWLPPGWVVEDRVRASGATAGTVDKYYFDPNSGRRFRSKIEVLYFLETGTLRKRKKSLDGNSADGSEEPKSKKSSSNAKSAPLNFDFFNVPEKVEWVLTDPSQEAWTPFINNEKVPESTKREWVAAFQLLGRSKV
ncbi:methyl-CpG-binding domain-containing protein 5-like isoform X2 [Cucurbita maxima]|uniref:Methyl-CpG-binding domain-containing protein 5-like isoform X2 n=1 Tax=Cucurbita maxima TaxID=3661 RepID=A0A6J1K9Z4_CUCMA|nr:methyl-CpG-binding domain-containing protein 5-like isoform X2 [Cucurbita maxima]